MTESAMDDMNVMLVTVRCVDRCMDLAIEAVGRAPQMLREDQRALVRRCVAECDRDIRNAIEASGGEV